MKVIVTGGTGFIGTALVSELVLHGHDVTVIDRNFRGTSQSAGITYYHADLLTDRLKPEWFDGADTLIHLAGRNLLGVWTPAYKQSLYDSRVESAQRILDVILHLSPERRPKAIISANAVGYYGSRGDEILTEASPPGKDFLAKLCKDWQDVWTPASDQGIRIVTVRTGIVLDKSGGMLARLVPIFRIGMGAVFGSGRQWFSWIGLRDLVSVYCLALERPDITGPVNAVGARPLRNREFSTQLAKGLGSKVFLRMPAWMLRLAGKDVANSLIASQRVKPTVLARLQFQYETPTVRQVLEQN